MSLPKTQGMSAVVTGLTEWVKVVNTWVHNFSSNTPGLGVENTPDNLWGYTLSLLGSIQGQCLTCPVQYTQSVLAYQVGARPLPESRQTLKCYATTLPMVYHFHLDCEPITWLYQGTGDQVICVLAKLNDTRSPTMNKSNTLYIRE